MSNDITSLISAVSSLLSAIIGPIVGFKIASRQLRISSQHTLVMEFRKLISDFIVTYRSLAWENFNPASIDIERKKQIISRLYCLEIQIKSLLDISRANHQKLVNEIKLAVDNCDQVVNEEKFKEIIERSNIIEKMSDEIVREKQFINL